MLVNRIQKHEINSLNKTLENSVTSALSKRKIINKRCPQKELRKDVKMKQPRGRLG